MKQYKIDFIELLIEAEALKFGEFTLKSGRVAPYFLNVGSFYTGDLITRLADAARVSLHFVWMSSSLTENSFVSTRPAIICTH